MINKNNSIIYRPSLINRFGKYFLLFLKSFLSDYKYSQISKHIHAIYKKILRQKYFISFLLKYLFLSKEKKIKKYLTYKLLPFTMGGYHALENAHDVTNIVDKNEIDGCIIECGVAEGGTAAMMALTNKQNQKIQRTLFLFDSFEGLPDPTEEDYIGHTTGEFIRPLSRGDCLGTIDQVRDLFINTVKMDQSKFHLIQGWFQDTVTSFDIKQKISILRLDGDWYESTKIPLIHFYPHVSIGGAIIIDDYATCYGARKAVDEFLKNNSINTQLISDRRGGAWFIKE